MQLHNKYNRKQLKEQLKEDLRPRTTLSFYQYWKLENPNGFRDDLFVQLTELNVLGRIFRSI